MSPFSIKGLTDTRRCIARVPQIRNNAAITVARIFCTECYSRSLFDLLASRRDDCDRRPVPFPFSPTVNRSSLFCLHIEGSVSVIVNKYDLPTARVNTCQDIAVLACGKTCIERFVQSGRLVVVDHYKSFATSAKCDLVIPVIPPVG